MNEDKLPTPSFYELMQARLYKIFAGNRLARDIFGGNRVIRKIVKYFFPIVSDGVYQIDISGICNARCVFCSYPRLAEDRGNLITMTDEVFGQVLEFIRKHKKRKLNYCPLVGDSFMNKNWAKYLQALLNEGYVTNVKMITNAILLDEQRLGQLLGLENLGKLSIDISVGGVDRSNYGFMFGVDKFDVVKANINRLTAALKENGLDVPVSVELRVADMDKVDLAVAAAVYNESLYRNFFVNVIDTYDALNDLSKAKESRLKILAQPEKTTPCVLLNSQVFRSDGTVRACCCVASVGPDDGELVLGNVADDDGAIIRKRETIISDWESRREIPRQCKTCTLYSPR